MFPERQGSGDIAGGLVDRQVQLGFLRFFIVTITAVLRQKGENGLRELLVYRSLFSLGSVVHPSDACYKRKDRATESNSHVRPEILLLVGNPQGKSTAKPCIASS